MADPDVPDDRERSAAGPDDINEGYPAPPTSAAYVERVFSKRAGQWILDETKRVPAPRSRQKTLFKKVRAQRTAHEEDRRFVAGIIIALLAAVAVIVVVTWAIAVIMRVSHDPSTAVDVQEVSSTLLTPLVAFAGPIVGFYFGTKGRKSTAQNAGNPTERTEDATSTATSEESKS